MLRLLQKKFTLEIESTRYLLFVLAMHLIVMLILFMGSLTTQPLFFSVKHLAQSSSVIIQWRSTSARLPNVSKSAVVESHPAPEKKVKKKMVQKPVKRAFTRIDLGPKKKKKVLPAKIVEQPQPKPISKPQESKPVVQPKQEMPAEPLVLSVQEYTQEKELAEIIDAVRRWWQPPLGVDTCLSCTIKVKISVTGAVENVAVEHSSGIPLYDISAKTALIKSNFPKKVWGKECVFQF